ncbi:MAG: hypothetical protein ABR577_03075 [Pyrinomonadaceae bacterium]
MWSRKKTICLLFTVIAVAVVTAMATLQSQGENKAQRPSIEEKNKDFSSKLPIADYEVSEPTDMESARRLAKSKTHNYPHGSKIDPSNPVRRASRYDWELGLASTLPTSQSSAIIIGEVVNAKAHLSEDKTNVYSEFTIRTEGILKDDSSEPIAIGDLIATERQSGRVRLPAGSISVFYVTGQNPPQVGRRYVLFLGYNRQDANSRSIASPRDMNRHILTGYEFRAGQIFPLDGAGGRNFQEHEGKDEVTFLNEIRRLITNPPQTSSK